MGEILVNIIVYTFPFRGHSMQAIDIANYLSKKGHFVTVDANPMYFQYMLPEIKKKECLYNFLKFEDNKKGNILDCAEGVLVTTQKYAKQFNEKVDLVIFDSMAYWGKYIADKNKIPSLSLFTIQPFTNDNFNNYAFDYLKTYMSKFNSSKDFFRNIHIYEVIAKRKFELTNDFSFNNFMCARGDTNIVLIPEAICKFSRDLNASYKAFSPILDCDDENFDKKNIIYIATGSMISDIKLLTTCIDTLFSMGKEIHVSSGKHTKTLEELYEKYNDVYFYEFAPQIDLLKKAAVFITHGGTNSICEAIAMKTPMVVIPIVNDEFLNAEMVVNSGIGLTIENNLSTIKDKLKEFCEQLLSDPTYSKNIKAVSKEVDSNKVWKAIEEFLGDINDG